MSELAPITPGSAVTLSPAAYALAQHLHEQLHERWEGLATAPVPQVSANIRAADVPADLRTRRAELIVEASDTAMLRRALSSDADAVAVDFDDTFSPTLGNVQAAYDALEWVAREGTQAGKPLLARTRALYAVEPFISFPSPLASQGPLPQGAREKTVAIAALCDLSAVIAARPQTPFHLYIPKLETPAQAQFWQDALLLTEAFVGLAPNTIRACLQIETFDSMLNLEAIFATLSPRTYGLNAGRWDYVFSLSKHLGQSRAAPLPPRSGLTMDVDAMRAYAEHLVTVCRRYGAEAIGGTASLAPDPSNPQSALDAVLADKQREATQGFTAAWAGLPELLESVRRGFDTPAAPIPPSTTDLYQRLTNLPDPSPLPVVEVQDAISLALDVFAAWYEGRGVVTRSGRIEDTATAELARAQVWQWVKVEAALEGGRRLTRERYLSERQRLLPDDASAAKLLDGLVLSATCADYFPRVAREIMMGDR